MSPEQIEIALRVGTAVLVGGLIGMERTFHGRPAGFRTHSLVALASALLMLLGVHQTEWMTEVEPDAIRTDPTRMAQGIMTGIGFLGAGLIFKEGLTVRGLTTAASIWVTAAIGILIGVGFYFLAFLGTAATLVILSLFRLIERRLPAEYYVQHVLSFARDSVMNEADLRQLVRSHGFTVSNLSHRTTDGGEQFEYRMMLRTLDPKNAERLSKHLRAEPTVREFKISPTGD